MNTPPAASAARASGCDVLIIGGGPAGSTAAALRAERGYRVILSEKAHHLRFNIGESLPGAIQPLLQKPGVADAVKVIGMGRWGADLSRTGMITNSRSNLPMPWKNPCPWPTWYARTQVDEILIRNASRKILCSGRMSGARR